MAYLPYTGLAVMCIIAFTVCGASPRPDSVKGTINMDTSMDGGFLKIPHWLHSAIASVKQLVPKNNIQGDASTGLYHVNKQDSTFMGAENSLPVLIHKEDEESGIKITPAFISDTDKVNPFVRSKRSSCTPPANLPEMVRELNSRLNSTQLIGLNPVEPTQSTTPSTPTNQPDRCPSNATGDWWPRSEVNLRSTCPWKLVPINLGENAFPRYVNNAVCMCQSCVGSPTMRCQEVTYDVTYFMRTGCENGLAVMETRNQTVTIGCYCVGAGIQTTIPNRVSE